MNTSVRASHSSETEFDGEAEGVADIPILLPVPFKELSNIQYFTTDEQLTQLTAALKEQFQRHCFIKIWDQKPQPLLVPLVKPYFTSSRNMSWYIEKVLSTSRARRAEDVDSELRTQRYDELANRDESDRENGSDPKKRRPDDHGWENLLGRE